MPYISRPIHKTTNTAETIYAAAVTVSNMTLSANNGDVSVDFHDGPGGEVLWTLTADDATGSTVCTHCPALYFPNGIYVTVTEDIVGSSLKALDVAICVPRSSGT